MGDKVAVVVECYSGSAYGERPRALLWQGKRRTIQTILDARQTPTGRAFSVQLEDNTQLEIEYDQARDIWTADGLTEV